MIYSASRRTDMVAFAPDRIVERVSRSRKLEAIVFWTKNPTNLVRHPGLALVAQNIPSVVQLTITGLGGTAWEPHVPDVNTVIGAVRELVGTIPSEAIRWRFDPIIATPDLEERFLQIKDKLTDALGSLHEVIVSFPDPYKKAVQRSVKAGLIWPQTTATEKSKIIGRMVEAFDGGSNKPVKLCCEPELQSLPGVGQAHCIDDSLFKKIYGLDLGDLDKDPGQRTTCDCVKSTDIGSYELACPHGCRYCYANPIE